MVSLNIDLATGKAFLTGGGGNSEFEWTTITPTISTTSSMKPTVILSYQRNLMLVNIVIAGNITADIPSVTIHTNNLFKGAINNFFGFTLNGQEKGVVSGSIAWNTHGVGMRATLTSGNIILTANNSSENFGGQAISFNSTVYLPPENWL